MNYIAQYIDEIRSGRIVTSEKVKKLYFNIIEPVILDKHPKYRFDEKRGEKIIKFMERFCWQSKGKWRGKPLKLLLFQKAKWQAIFGIIHRETGLRRFQEIFDVRARKNCKTTEHAPVGLYLTREEDGAEVYACAATYKQAKRVWGEAKSMVAQNPALSGNKSPRKGKIGHGPYMWKVFPESDIYISERDSHFIALASNVDALDGLNSSAAIIDEVHTLTREIYDLIKQSMSARSQPLLSMISTGGFVREGAMLEIENSGLTPAIIFNVFPKTLLLSSTKSNESKYNVSISNGLVAFAVSITCSYVILYVDTGFAPALI